MALQWGAVAAHGVYKSFKNGARQVAFVFISLYATSTHREAVRQGFSTKELLPLGHHIDLCEAKGT